MQSYRKRCVGRKARQALVTRFKGRERFNARRHSHVTGHFTMRHILNLRRAAALVGRLECLPGALQQSFYNLLHSGSLYRYPLG